MQNATAIPGGQTNSKSFESPTQLGLFPDQNPVQSPVNPDISPGLLRNGADICRCINRDILGDMSHDTDLSHDHMRTSQIHNHMRSSILHFPVNCVLPAKVI